MHVVAAIAAVTAILFVASSGTALAANVKHDPKGDSPIADLDIKQYGIAGKKAYIMVYGTAGGTLADHDHAIAYVLNVVTTSGEEQTWAVDSHEKQHGDAGVGAEWHAHRVNVVDGCVNEVDQVNPATVKNKHVWFENMVVRGNSGNPQTVGVAEITSALTVELHVLVDDPDNPPPGTECIAEVSAVYDTA
jgi:hypothetical protein